MKRFRARPVGRFGFRNIHEVRSIGWRGGTRF